MQMNRRLHGFLDFSLFYFPYKYFCHKMRVHEYLLFQGMKILCNLSKC